MANLSLNEKDLSRIARRFIGSNCLVEDGSIKFENGNVSFEVNNLNLDARFNIKTNGLKVTVPKLRLDQGGFNAEFSIEEDKQEAKS